MGCCLSQGELKIFLDADRVDLVFVPFLRAWEEATVTYQPRGQESWESAQPAVEVSERRLDIKSWSLKEEARYNIVSKAEEPTVSKHLNH